VTNTPATFKQLDIWWVTLDPTQGAETQKKRPCVVIQHTLVNQGSKTVIVVPILPGHKPWPFVVNVKPSASNGLDKERHLNLKQLRAVDVSRISGQQGVLEAHYLPLIHQTLKLVFGQP
jgi:mRNA interferase MazF